MTMTWEEIIAYEDLKVTVTTYVAERQDTELPTIRQLAQQFKIGPADMLTLVEDTDELMYNIGIRIQSWGDHVHRFIGDYTVETF